MPIQFAPIGTHVAATNPPPINILCMILFRCVILFWVRYYFDHPLFVYQIFVVMVLDAEVPFFVDVIEARQHDELVVEHVFFCRH